MRVPKKVINHLEKFLKRLHLGWWYFQTGISPRGLEVDGSTDFVWWPRDRFGMPKKSIPLNEMVVEIMEQSPSSVHRHEFQDN